MENNFDWSFLFKLEMVYSLVKDTAVQ